MAKQLNVNLVFNADTEKAKARMAELQTNLNNLNNSFATKTLRNPLTPGLKEAQIEATKLNAALQASMNVNTGKFDLSKFNQSLKSSGTNLTQLHAKLTAIGPAGRQAFMSLAQNIV